MAIPNFSMMKGVLPVVDIRDPFEPVRELVVPLRLTIDLVLAIAYVRRRGSYSIPHNFTVRS